MQLLDRAFDLVPARRQRAHRCFGIVIARGGDSDVDITREPRLGACRDRQATYECIRSPKIVERMTDRASALFSGGSFEAMERRGLARRRAPPPDA